MLRLLLFKDLRRAWRNPMAWLVHLGMPLLITALIGLTFAPRSENPGFGRIKLAVVDEDDSMVTRFLRGALNQPDAGKYLEPHFLARDDALRQLTNNQLSAVLILPAGFTRNYLTGREGVALELVKNPAQALHPAIVEELLGALVTLLNAVSRNLQSEFPEWEAALQTDGGPDMDAVADLLRRAGHRMESARSYLFPPLVTYTKATRADQPKTSGPGWNMFAFLLPGMAAMFLLFLADQAMRDLYRELRFRTFQRFRTLHSQLLVFISAKVAFAVAIVLIGAVIILGGGAVIFRFRWEHPAALAGLLVAYGLFAAGLMALLAALAGTEKRVDILNPIFGMALGLAGGCMFPRDQLPALLRDHVTPWLPTHWLVEAMRAMQFGWDGPPWGRIALQLALLGLLCIALSAGLFQRRLERQGGTAT